MSSSGAFVNSIKPEDVTAWTLDIEVSLHHQPFLIHWCARRAFNRHSSLGSLTVSGMLGTRASTQSSSHVMALYKTIR